MQDSGAGVTARPVSLPPLSPTTHMAGTSAGIHRGALPIASEIPDTISKLVADVEALRAGLLATATAVNAVITAAATNIAAVAAVTPVVKTTFDTAADMTGYALSDH